MVHNMAVPNLKNSVFASAQLNGSGTLFIYPLLRYFKRGVKVNSPSGICFCSTSQP